MARKNTEINVPAKKKAGTKGKAKSTEKKENYNTRDLILSKSLEIINHVGVVDFRIETIAEELGLSPGNITYHFSRKEDICVVLWEQFIEKFKAFNMSLSGMLDLKQTYLIFRTMTYLFYDYRGVVIFRGGDIGAMSRDLKHHRTILETSNDFSKAIVSILQKNGLLASGRNETLNEISVDYEFLIRRWWINLAYIENPKGQLKERINEYALLILYSFYPFFTDKGKEEFNFISQIVEKGEMNA